jgi:tetratricopeptide (TPR) repeat protein
VAVWAERDPENIDAHRHAADLLLRAGRFDEAIEHMEQVKILGGLAKFDVFAYRAANMQPAQRRTLLSAMDEMLARHPGDEQLLFSRAVLLEQEGRLEEALRLTDELLPTSKDVNVAVLKMSLLTSLKRRQEARVFMELQVETLPENRRLRLILARLLFEMNDLEAARNQYSLVLEKSPNDGDVLFALALIALEQKDDELAARYFERMVRWDRRPGEAHYYLGGIAERQGDVQKAIREYRQAGDGYEFIPAHARIAGLLFDDGRPDEAREHLDRTRKQVPARGQQLIMVEAQLLADRGLEEEVLAFLDDVVEADPQNIEMLYFRAMTGQRFDRLDILEQDLRAVIAIDPENADALNALGYTLTDQTDRHEEALSLIERALALKPDEAAFIDSMGWVQYRLNNFEAAVAYLRRALELFQNDEVAAHLGEVLFVMGKQLEAQEVWEEALKLAPDSEFLREVIQRFGTD